MLASIQVMGILNVTPDSFYDGGQFRHPEKALRRALQMIQEGADVIDIGGESTRPFAVPVNEQEECDRILPIIERIKQETDVCLSVDTRHPLVMREAIRAGADWINDVCALQTQGALEVIAKSKVSVCLVHMQGTPQTMQQDPHYQDLLQEVYNFFVERLEACEKAGIPRTRIMLDPGFGFGKTMAHNFTLLGRLGWYRSFGCRLLVGLSRKSFLGALLKVPAAHRLCGSLAATVFAMTEGAEIIRTHDVKSTWEAVQVLKALEPYSKLSGVEHDVAA